MAHHTEQVGFPNVPIQPGMRLKLEALSVTTDAAVAGVTCSRWSVYGVDQSEQPPDFETLPVLIVPPSGAA